MEDGYLNATARLNAGTSTLATLSVPGGSTFTGSVTFSSIATFSTKVAAASTTVMLGDSTTPFKEVHCSSLYVGGAALDLAPTCLRVSGSTSQVAAGSTAAIAWPTQDVISNSSLHSTSANAERFVPQTTGTYILAANLTWSTMAGTTSTRSFTFDIQDSSGGLVAWQSVVMPEAGGGVSVGGGPSVHLSGMKRFDSVAGSTQWLRITMRNAGGSTNSMHGTYTSAHFFKL